MNPPTLWGHQKKKTASTRSLISFNTRTASLFQRKKYHARYFTNSALQKFTLEHFHILLSYKVVHNYQEEGKLFPIFRIFCQRRSEKLKCIGIALSAVFVIFICGEPNYRQEYLMIIKRGEWDWRNEYCQIRLVNGATVYWEIALSPGRSGQSSVFCVVRRRQWSIGGWTG